MPPSHRLVINSQESLIKFCLSSQEPVSKAESPPPWSSNENKATVNSEFGGCCMYILVGNEENSTRRHSRALSEDRLDYSSLFKTLIFKLCSVRRSPYCKAGLVLANCLCRICVVPLLTKVMDLMACASLALADLRVALSPAMRADWVRVLGAACFFVEFMRVLWVVCMLALA